MSVKPNKTLAVWLSIVSFFIVVLVIFGGYVRLTRSGLSMVEWHVITGMVPPVGEEAWQEAFAKYQLTPEFIKINKSMTVDEYKFIYYNEYIHRMLGRWTGMLYVVPLFYFMWKGMIPWRKSSFYLIIGLGFAFQGLLGWYMVSSGLVDRPSVSHYRLTAHLVTALGLLALCWWAIICNIYGSDEVPDDRPARKSAQRLAVGLVVVLMVQISYGGLVAGLKAGHASNTWPLMFGKLIPPGLLSFVEPWWLNLLELPITVHYVHRWFAFAVLVMALILYYVTRHKGYYAAISSGIWTMVGLVCLQIALGVGVIWFHVPAWLALVHQGVAITLLLTALFINFQIRLARAQEEQVVVVEPV
ncbi:MAG: heme A synthase [Chloroflexi bacterium]|nr:MAG: heme A synthase [Chloroflexota bacterium]